jgi:hypothetical protein
MTICWGAEPALRVPTGLVVTMPIERRKLLEASLSAGDFVVFWYLFMKYHRVNGSLPSGGYPWQGHDVIRRAPQVMQHQAVMGYILT